MIYHDYLTKAMTALGTRDDVVFIGQSVAYPGTAMYKTLEGVPVTKRIELPVMEDAQLGIAIGLSLNGFLPICIYPRINFLLLAVNQLANHLDKLPLYGNGWRPKVIIRTAVAHDEPMNPGIQHLGDYTVPLGSMLKTVTVRSIWHGHHIEREYEHAADRLHSTLLVERTALYEV